MTVTLKSSKGVKSTRPDQKKSGCANNGNKPSKK